MSYELVIYGNDPGSWDKCYVSTHMITHGLVEEFSALAAQGVMALKAVINSQKDPLGQTIPPCDVLLVHNYFASMEREFSFDVAEIKKRVRCLALFLELGAVNADISFTYQRTLCKRTGYEVIIPQPYIAGLTRVVEKTPRSLLLDHDYPRGGWPGNWDEFVAKGEGHCKEIYEILEPLHSRFEVFQLERFPQVRQHKPRWLKLIPQTYFPDYLRMTERIETFIPTHPGSFNHTVVDMATRGSRILAVTGYLSHELATNVGATVVGSWLDLRRLLLGYDRLPAVHPKLGSCTSMDRVVRIMDAEFRQFLKLGGTL